MDTDVTDIKEALARIDERTISILTSQEKIAEGLESHEARDRVDFKEVHHRVTKVEKKQNWMLGVVSAVVFVATAIAGILAAPFTGV